MLVVHICGIPWGICVSTQRERSREKERVFPGGLFEGCSWLQLFAWWHVRCAVHPASPLVGTTVWMQFKCKVSPRSTRWLYAVGWQYNQTAQQR